ncbi:hypothetical protein BC834DRAFT_875730 [Gloeopeniophorella convolvens]|nr:hypothetical protein BC834DRAFT_875730 [Gloeopeniophorella convolvens]
MAAVAAPAAFHANHFLAPHHSGFAAFHHQHRGSAPAPHNPFEAFAPHRHGGARSPAAATSWRHTESVERAPAPAAARAPSPKRRSGGPSHSRTPSTSSEASSGSWRSHSRSPAVSPVELHPVAQHSNEPKPSAAFVYSATDLLRLSASPLVGINAESRAIVDDLVAHHVWRRGPQTGGPKTRRNNRPASRPRSHQSSTDDSEHSD